MKKKDFLIVIAELKGTKISSATESVGIPRNITKSWLLGTAEPSAEEIEKLASSLGFSIQDYENCENLTYNDIVKMYQNNTDTYTLSNDNVSSEDKTINKSNNINKNNKNNVKTKREPKKKENIMNAPTEAPTASSDNLEFEQMPLPEMDEITSPNESLPEMEPVSSTEFATEFATAVTEKKEKKKKDPSPSKKKKEPGYYSSNFETVARETLNIKKSETLTPPVLSDYISKKSDEVSKALTDVSAQFEALGRVITCLDNELALPEHQPVKIDSRYDKLLAAAETASDEDIEFVVSMLQRMKK